MGFFVCMKREGDEKGTAEQSEGKNHPVNGFLVPRAGGGTAPVPPDESHLLRQQQKDTPAVSFCYNSYDFYTRSRRKLWPFYAKMPI